MNKLHLYHLYISRTIAVSAAVCALSVFLYGVFLLQAVAHTAQRTGAERQITKLTSKLGELEVKYLSQTQALTPEQAAALGFVRPSSVDTVYATVPGSSLSFQKLVR